MERGPAPAMKTVRQHGRPSYAEKIVLPESLRSVDFATITRTDGSKQTTFKGWPLYLYSRDGAEGDTFGNGQKGLWHVIDPDGIASAILRNQKTLG